MAWHVTGARVLALVNAPVLTLGRGVGIVCMALMVVFILVQVFWRYVLSNPLPWPEEAARFLMLWLMVVAPTGLRRGGFVAIDMIQLVLPRIAGGLLTLFLLLLSLVVLVVGVKIGFAEVTGFSGRFKTSSLYYPTLEGWVKMPRSWMMASLVVGLAMMVSVTVELILRQIAVMAGAGNDLPVIPEASTVGAE
ncbi:TRAP transporter small permease [Jannaschia seohaensis]|uniref:TRAP transporter small permease protein n=1 Tax=Jannaschia seohaensis TaxID=475081 RepID=A0A2Y9C2L5_9RHOB|nr:TRAP transporter small permease [Jannaschia seohaensis]PWJ15083.1 TRAP-type C4-dicarboxylate transport system permease small subunit [Jannaschia seohaensis]SSA49932.1 TRAP-type C4-dicarboxylate transport system, small permease component [Jannaschia seohaensis]